MTLTGVRRTVHRLPMVDLSANPLSNALRRRLVSAVQRIFNDASRGETPVVRSAEALYDPGSVIWRVHGDVTTMMVGGVTALLLQMLHPAALAGVWNHSSFRDDMLGRLRRTARFIALTTYAERSQAEAAIAQVRAVHLHITGELADGTTYAASDPALLAWVHVCETLSFLTAWIRYAEPAMSLADQDTYVAQSGLIARQLGADPVPQTRAEAEALLARFRADLVVDDRTRSVARTILDQAAPHPAAAPIQRMVMQAAVDLLPPWARRMHGLKVPAVAIPLLRTGTLAAARTLSWAFATNRGVPRTPR